MNNESEDKVRYSVNVVDYIMSSEYAKIFCDAWELINLVEKQNEIRTRIEGKIRGFYKPKKPTELKPYAYGRYPHVENFVEDTNYGVQGRKNPQL
jgi:hypothetical protein